MPVLEAKEEWSYRRSICTGLGDRLGVILSLAAVARAYNNGSMITFRWCQTDGAVQAALDNPLHMRYIPGWTGYSYPLWELHAHFELPPGVRIVGEWSEADPQPLLSDLGSASIPPLQGLPFLPSLGHAIFAAEGKPRLTASAFRQAYEESARMLRPLSVAAELDIIVHLRAWY